MKYENYTTSSTTEDSCSEDYWKCPFVQTGALAWFFEIFWRNYIETEDTGSSLERLCVCFLNHQSGIISCLDDYHEECDPFNGLEVFSDEKLTGTQGLPLEDQSCAKRGFFEIQIICDFV